MSQNVDSNVKTPMGNLKTIKLKNNFFNKSESSEVGEESIHSMVKLRDVHNKTQQEIVRSNKEAAINLKQNPVQLKARKTGREGL